MGCYKNAGGLKKVIAFKKSMSKKYNWRSVLYISIVLFTPLLSAKSYVNKHVKPQDALTISSSLTQSSAFIEAKRLQITTEKLVNINSTGSHYKKLPYKKLYSSKIVKIICYTLL
jgi:hypothetical protein